MCNRIKVYFCLCGHRGYMSVEACDHTITTGTKCHIGSPHIKWLCDGYEFRVAAVCWQTSCRADPVAARIQATRTPRTAPTLTRTEQLNALSFLFTQCPVLYVPYCQQETLDSQLSFLPWMEFADIAKPSVEDNWFAAEVISIFDMPDIEPAEVSRSLALWLGPTDDAEPESARNA